MSLPWGKQPLIRAPPPHSLLPYIKTEFGWEYPATIRVASGDSSLVLFGGREILLCGVELRMYCWVRAEWNPPFIPFPRTPAEDKANYEACREFYGWVLVVRDVLSPIRGVCWSREFVDEPEIMIHHGNRVLRRICELVAYWRHPRRPPRPGVPPHWDWSALPINGAGWSFYHE